MAIAKLTIAGLLTYIPTLFDELTLPEGLNKEVVVSSILKTCGDFPLIYPDGEYMLREVPLWGLKYQRAFERWMQVYTVDYNPLYNVDAQINITDEMEGTNFGQSEAINQVSAFDSVDFQNRDKLEGSSSGETKSKNIHTEDRHGNIGVTKSTDLIASEVDLRRWNVYNEIADCFCKEFCIPVYD